MTPNSPHTGSASDYNPGMSMPTFTGFHQYGRQFDNGFSDEDYVEGEDDGAGGGCESFNYY